MKIQKVTEELRTKVYGLLRIAFPDSEHEAGLVQRLHEHGKPLHEWVCVHANKAIAYIAFSNAYDGNQVCGLHLASMAVAPEFQKQGVGTELLNFALRQESIKSQPLFVSGEPRYFKRFGFEPGGLAVRGCGKNGEHLLGMRNNAASPCVVGYEAEFSTAVKPPKTQPKKRR